MIKQQPFVEPVQLVKTDFVADPELGKRLADRTQAVLDEQTAGDELLRMLNALRRDPTDYFALGKYRARKKLSNGAVVTFTVTMPAVKAAGS